jgi:hypothetical protein
MAQIPLQVGGLFDPRRKDQAIRPEILATAADEPMKIVEVFAIEDLP